MSERRMFAKTIIDSDAFLELPLTSQLLYFHLAMRADDDGFVNKPRSIMRVIGAKDEDMRTLINNKFVIVFDSGVVVIKHWRIHNYIRNDRYKETKYKFEKASLFLDENNAYSLTPQGVKPDGIPNGDETDTVGIPPVSKMDTQVRLGKESIGKDSIGEVNCSDAPTLSDIQIFAQNEGLSLNSSKFFNHYSAIGWKVNGQTIENWKALVRKWAAEDASKPAKKQIANFTPADIDLDMLRANLERI